MPASRLAVVCTLLVLAGQIAGAALARGANASAYELVEKGNAAYQAGRYEEALGHYNAASVETPESPQLYFNQGTVRYQQGDYEAAAKAFAEAAVRGKEPAFEALARYNQGNCAFREAERQRDSDLNKAIDACRDAIVSYQDALKLDPQLQTAAENIEIVRLYVKALLDEQQQREEEKQQQDDLGEKLKELLGRQIAAVQDNDALTRSLPAQVPASAAAPRPAWESQSPAESDDPLADAEPRLGESSVQTNGVDAPFDVVAQDSGGAPADADAAAATADVSEAAVTSIEQHTATQRTLQEDTVVVLEQMRQLESQMTQPPAAANTPPPSATEPMAERLETAIGHVTESVNAQGEALRELGGPAGSEPGNVLASARAHQQQSAVQLAEALKALSDPDQQQEPQQGGDQDQQQQQQQQDQQDQQGDDQDGDQQEGQQEQDQSGKADDNSDGGGGESPQQDQEPQQDQGQRSEEGGDSAPQQSALKPLGDSAEDILNEEKENQKRRVPVRVGGVRPVDKDW